MYMYTKFPIVGRSRQIPPNPIYTIYDISATIEQNFILKVDYLSEMCLPFKLVAKNPAYLIENIRKCYLNEEQQLQNSLNNRNTCSSSRKEKPEVSVPGPVMRTGREKVYKSM